MPDPTDSDCPSVGRGAGRRREEAQPDVRRVKGLLQRFKLLPLFEAMPAEIRLQFFDCCYPDPVLVFDPSLPSSEAFGGLPPRSAGTRG